MADNLLEAPVERKGAIVEFSKGFFHQAVESPVNALSQIYNKAIVDPRNKSWGNGELKHIPSLEISGAPSADSIAGAAGSIVGGALQFVALSKLTGAALANRVGEGVGAKVLRAGITGGVFAGVLTPSAENSDSFITDRLKSAAVGAATFASMAGVTSKLDQAGIFKVAEIRSLGGHIASGGLAGAAGGVAHAQADAMVTKGQFLPTMADLQSDIISYASFGAVMSTVGWASHRLMSSTQLTEKYARIPTSDGFEEGHLKLVSGADGKILKVQADYMTGDMSRSGWISEKMTNGSWKTKGIQMEDFKWKSSKIDVPEIAKFEPTITGSIGVTFKNGEVSKIFPHKGEYSPTSPDRYAVNFRLEKQFAKTSSEQLLQRQQAAKAQQESPSAQAKASTTRYDYFQKQSDTNNKFDPGYREYPNRTTLYIDEPNSKVKLAILTLDDKSYELQRGENQNWKITESFKKGPNSPAPKHYNFKGELNIIASSDPAKASALEIKPQNGTAVRLEREAEDYSSVLKALLGYAKETVLTAKDMGKSSFIRMDAKGKLFIGTQASEKPLKLGEKLTFTWDFGDRRPDWRSVETSWAKSIDGKSVIINGIELKRGGAISINSLKPDF